MGVIASLLLKIGLPLLIAGGVYVWINNAAYNRGHAAAQAEHEIVLRRMESALTEAIKKNEQLTDPELDCRLKRIRNPSATC